MLYRLWSSATTRRSFGIPWPDLGSDPSRHSYAPPTRRPRGTPSVSCPAPQSGEISCLEVMVDLLISFQILSPLNKKNLKRKHGQTSHLEWEHTSVVNYLPSPDEAALLPPPLLTECHATWLHTLDFLKPLVNLIPVERTARRSLLHLGYSNMLPSWPSRALLLAGSSASQLLASIIRTGARKLKYPYVIPRRPRRPLPPCFGENFN